MSSSAEVENRQNDVVCNISKTKVKNFLCIFHTAEKMSNFTHKNLIGNLSNTVKVRM